MTPRIRSLIAVALIVAMPVATIAQQPGGALSSSAAAQSGSQHGHLHVLNGTQGWHQMKCLKDEPNLARAIAIKREA